jgi:phospho-N-acetylmuramoyl-pentapeptide-transferase
MLWLFDQLAARWPEGEWLNWLADCTKITFRTMLAALMSFALALFFGPHVIRWLTKRFREPPSDRAPALEAVQKQKAWTPSMGGLFIVAGILTTSVLLCNWQNSYVPIVLANLLWLATIGAVDDVLKLSGRSKRGMRPRMKMIGQIVVAFAIATWLYFVQRQIPGGLDLQIPVLGKLIPLGISFIPLAMLVIVGSSNAVNLTDGLDGLAAGSLIASTSAIAAVTYIAGHVDWAAYVGVTHIAEAGETVVIAGAMIGATLGFLWFNCHPAQVFMGDTGALSLGGTLGLLAIIARQELLLVLIGGVFVAEAISVIVQVRWHRWTGRRIFRCAPLHHHFQLLGWPENKIVMRFWIVSVLCALFGLGALKLHANDPKAGDSKSASQIELTARANLTQAGSVLRKE